MWKLLTLLFASAMLGQVYANGGRTAIEETSKNKRQQRMEVWKGKAWEKEPQQYPQSKKQRNKNFKGKDNFRD